MMPRSKILPILFFASFLVWIFCFREFLFHRYELLEDAISYYNHIKFYIDNMGHGVYPLWDTYWNSGMNNEFFLRRFGAFNPFLLLILIFKCIGLSHVLSYLAFFAVYFFIGMIGFYMLANCIFRNTTAAFSAYLLLMFSSLGTRFFDSYFLFMTIPMIWFFYFLIAFANNQKKHLLLGLTFTVMLIATTYIPFYFFTAFLTFCICILLIYYRAVKECVGSILKFFNMNKLFTIFCIFAAICSLLPGVLFYKSAGKGELALPLRHYNSTAENVLEVNKGTITSWGIEEEIMHAYAYQDLRKMKFAILYIPIFAFILLFLGAFMTVNKRLFLFFIMAGMIFFIHSPYFPIYHFFYKHIFYFRYFRNLHFFLWIFILPLFILFIVEQFRLFLNYKPNTGKEKLAILFIIALIHGLCFWILYRQGNAIITSYCAVGMSLVFFILNFWSKMRGNKFSQFLLCLLFVGIIVQPLEVYHYLKKNTGKPSNDVNRSYVDENTGNLTKYNYIYDKTNLDFSFTRWVLDNTVGIYAAVKWYYRLYQNIDRKILRKYNSHKFKLYDHVERMNEEDFNKISQAFKSNRNIAYVASDDQFDDNTQKTKNNAQAQIITGNSDQFRVLKFNSNSIKIKSNFDTRKFLVYNDVYHSNWMAFINGEKTKIFRTNVAFKGLWIPPGENIIYFRFGAMWQHFLNYFLLGLFNLILYYLIYCWVQSKRSLNHVHT